jgi:hypothetical protein
MDLTGIDVCTSFFLFFTHSHSHSHPQTITQPKDYSDMEQSFAFFSNQITVDRDSDTDASSAEKEEQEKKTEDSEPDDDQKAASKRMRARQTKIKKKAIKRRKHRSVDPKKRQKTDVKTDAKIDFSGLSFAKGATPDVEEYTIRHNSLLRRMQRVLRANCVNLIPRKQVEQHFSSVTYCANGLADLTDPCAVGSRLAFLLLAELRQHIARKEEHEEEEEGEEEEEKVPTPEDLAACGIWQLIQRLLACTLKVQVTENFFLVENSLAFKMVATFFGRDLATILRNPLDPSQSLFDVLNVCFDTRGPMHACYDKRREFQEFVDREPN